MTTPFDGFPEGKSRLVYVRPVLVDDLPEEVRQQVGDQGVIYSVHAVDGQRLALVADRALAFNLARAHDFAPMSVH